MNIEIEKGKCAALIEAAILEHEKSHKAHQQELGTKYGENTEDFLEVWNNGEDWYKDEIKAYQALIDQVTNTLESIDKKCGLH